MVIARKHQNKWYIAGINGQRSAQTVELDLSIFKKQKASIITEGESSLSFTQKASNAKKKQSVVMKEAGGFVVVLE